MKNKLFLPIILSLPVASISISCKYEDYEKLEKDKEDIEDKKQNFIPQSKEAQEIKKLYDNELTNLFKKTKENYSNYRTIWNNLIRNISLLRNKLKKLEVEQSIITNKEYIKNFINKWFLNSSSLSTTNKLASYMYKYELIYQDVDAVLADVNLVLEAKEFIKYLKTIDDRLLGKDIKLETLQSALLSIWKFINQHIYNPNKITKNLDDVNLEEDKNSHNHSHAIINLIHELGLWHKELIKHKDLQISDFINDFNNIKSKILDNINHLEYESNFKRIIETFSKSKNPKPNYDLNKQYYKDEGQLLLNKVKTILEKIRNDAGLKESDLKFE